MSCVMLGTWSGGCSGGTPQKACAEGDTCSGSTNNAEGDDESSSPAGDTTKRDAGKVDAGKLDAGAKSDSAARRDAGKVDKGIDLPCDIAAILDKNCGSCHGDDPAFGAPMTLTSATDFAAASKTDRTQTVLQLTKTRINASDVTKRMPPLPGQLSSAELKTLNAWLDAGAEGVDGASCSAGDAGVTDAGMLSLLDAGDPHDDPSLTCYKLVANAGDGVTPFSVGAVRDGYFNAVFAAPWQGTAYARVISPIIDNKKVIHHWLLFEDDVPGLPSAPTSATGAHPGGQLIMGWAPGGPANDFRQFPDDLGFELPATTYTIEFHYNSDDFFATDMSGAEICVTKDKPKYTVGLSWLGTDNLLLPSTTWTGTCAPASQQPIHIIGVNPHMHLQGRHIKAIINRKDGSKETLQDSDFDFNYQVSYLKDVVINPGDSISTTCTFAQPMTFGESTNAEMCYLFTLAYPAGALADLGGWGSIAHGGSSCLGM